MTDQKSDQPSGDGLRFYIDHGVIHDRATGKHVVTDGQPPFEDGVEQVLALLNSLCPAGERSHPLSDINDLDDVCRELGIQDSHVTPAQAVKELNEELERLRSAPSPTRDGAEGADTESTSAAVRESNRSTPRSPASAAMGHCARVDTATPVEPAPDAIREARRNQLDVLHRYRTGAYDLAETALDAILAIRGDREP